MKNKKNTTLETKQDDKGYMNRYQFVAGHRLFEILQLGKSIC
jgi:hypothetical protein